MAVIDEGSPKVGGDDKRAWFERIPAAYWIVGVLLLIMPLLVNEFALYQIFGWTFILAIIALGMMLLAGYGGMVSIAQMKSST